MFDFTMVANNIMTLTTTVHEVTRKKEKGWTKKAWTALNRESKHERIQRIEGD